MHVQSDPIKSQWMTKPVQMTHDGILSCWSRQHSLTTAVLNVRQRLSQSTLKYQPKSNVSQLTAK